MGQNLVRESGFRRLDERGSHLTIYFDGEAVMARPGETVAAALLAAGHRRFRTAAVGGAARGPFCMMGACFECLAEIDGEPNRQTCMVEAADGMKVRPMVGPAGGRHE